MQEKDWNEQGIAKQISSWRVDLSEMVLADKPIPAVIARSINSSHPTPVTAVVERNVYAEEGRNVIIPAGSRMIGSLGSVGSSQEATANSAKIEITWERLIRPDGVMFVFQGITGDAMGRGGALGYLDQQLFKKYSMPVLSSMLTSAASYIMAPPNDQGGSDQQRSPRQEAANDARQNFLNQMNQVFDQMLQDQADIKPLVYIPAGTRIIVYPNIDLWLRTPDRDTQDSANQMTTKDILLDDKQTTADAKKENAKRTNVGNVVYDSGNDQPAPASAPLLNDQAMAQQRTNNAAARRIPPPPPSYSGATAPAATPAAKPAASSPAASGSGSGSSPSGNVPQLF